MKNSILSIAAMALLSGNAIAQQKPNIILFLVDDMGWQDTSLPFWNDTTELNHIYETPNMERLAKKGVRFTHAYACPISSPSRVSLFTGANAARRVPPYRIPPHQFFLFQYTCLSYICK